MVCHVLSARGVASSHPGFMDTMRECNFPIGFDVSHWYEIFDGTSEGPVDKEASINGMVRLIFNDLHQQGVQGRDEVVPRWLGQRC